MIEIDLSTQLQQLITPNQAWHYRILPKNSNDNTLELYADESFFSDDTLNELEILTGKEIVVNKISSEVIQKGLSRFYRLSNHINQVSSIEATAMNNDFLHQLIGEAKTLGSSDIHVETYKESCRIRIRIDGLLVERYSIKKDEYPSLINKIKINSNLDISEKRLPQDGRMLFAKGIEKFDIRVSILPTLYGEKIVLRLLSNDASSLNIEDLGFDKIQLTNYLEGIKKPNGIVLISGPTGSGKTTTLYATLKLLNKENTNVLTIEDPIEYTLAGINQVQLKESIGLTYASALRTFLRQDPDIIMLGEIRDSETAQMAIRAALTGHLVLSTIHTNSAWGIISRLIDMGVPPFLLSSTINTTVAQRLVKLLCTYCKTEESFNEKAYPKNYLPPEKIKNHFISAGCEACHYTGYKGRKAIYEIIPIDSDFSICIKNNSNPEELLRRHKISSLSVNGFELFKKGLTSLDEIYPLLLI